MKETKEIFKNIVNRDGKLSCKELNDFFANLEPITINEVLGEWRIGYLFTKERTGSKWEALIRYSPIGLYGKKFLDRNNVKAWVFRFFGINFSMPMASAVLRKVNFKNKISTSMIYNYLPIIDHFRKVDKNTVMGMMEVKGKIGLYFYLKRENGKNIS